MYDKHNFHGVHKKCEFRKNMYSAKISTYTVYLLSISIDHPIQLCPTFPFSGFTEAAHLTKPVPLPEGVTIWDVCGMTVEHIKYEYDQCNKETERYVAEHGSGMAAQCK